MAMMAEHHIEILKTTRSNFLKVLDGLTDEHLNKIPDGFNNNVIWNFAHNLATQQLLCYKLTGAEMRLGNSVIEKYRKGTSPDEPATVAEIQRLKLIALESCDWLLEDYKAGKLTENPFNEYTTSYNITLKSVEDAIRFNNVHESLHLGYAMALRKLIQ